jgi:hypothetical protein
VRSSVGAIARISGWHCQLRHDLTNVKDMMSRRHIRMSETGSTIDDLVKAPATLRLTRPNYPKTDGSPTRACG